MGSWKDLIWERKGQDEAEPTPSMPSRPISSATRTDIDEMADTIRKAALGRKTPFTALCEASDKLLNVIADAPTRMKAAYAMVGSESRSIDQISKAIDIHIADVDGEKMRFLQATRNKRAVEVDGLKSKASDLERAGKDLQKEYESLQSRSAELVSAIGTNRSQIDSTNAEVLKKESEIVSVEQQFETAVQRVKDEFGQQKKVILSTLR
jgi:chromosome segregation ATPase